VEDAGFDPRGHARSDRAARPAHLIGYGIDRTYKGLICGITLHSAHVNLMFARGTELPDPDHLLVGTGKRARHVKIQQSAEIENPAVRALLVGAYAGNRRR
jgi:hypothetical protein